MTASQQTIQQIERAIRKVAANFPTAAEPVLTDIHLWVNAYTGELRSYDDDDVELDRCVVEEWIKSTQDDFYTLIAPILRECIERMRSTVESMSIMRPFSFVLIDEDHETLQDLVIIDDNDTVVLDGNLLEGLEEDLDNFWEKLLSE